MPVRITRAQQSSECEHQILSISAMVRPRRCFIGWSFGSTARLAVVVFEKVGDAGESVAEDDFLGRHVGEQRWSVWVLSSSSNTYVAESIDFSNSP